MLQDPDPPVLRKSLPWSQHKLLSAQRDGEECSTHGLYLMLSLTMLYQQEFGILEHLETG